MKLTTKRPLLRPWQIVLFTAISVFTTTSHPASDKNSQPVEFELADPNGKMHKLSEYRGQWLVINFWATWCGPCIREIPVLNAFHKRHQTGKKTTHISVIGINFEQLEDTDLKAFISKHKIRYPVLRIGSKPLIPMEPLKGLPSTFLISPEGLLIDHWLGELESDTLESWLPDED